MAPSPTKLQKVLNNPSRPHHLVSVIGSQWGDEGKGKLVDHLAPQFNIVARFNGGSNAGHTIIANGRKFAFHLLPCGMLYPHVTNVIGAGVVVHHKTLFQELEDLKKSGVDTIKNLKVSSRAHILFNFHKEIDAISEKNLREAKIGTTRRGIGPCMASKAYRLGVRMADLMLNFGSLEEKYLRAYEWAESVCGQKLKTDKNEEIEKLAKFQKLIFKNVCDTSIFLQESLNKGEKLLAEGANATMLDINFGTYPFVTSSLTTNGGIYSGLGIPPKHPLYSIGIAKAYTTRVGSGPFLTEITDSKVSERICHIGREFGTTTGRKRRIGWFDAVLVRFSTALNGFDSINLTKLDVLSGLDEIKLCVDYEHKESAEILPKNTFPPSLDELGKMRPVIKIMKGWTEDISKITEFKDLPANAQRFVKEIEKLVQVKVQWVGVGADRNALLYL